MKINKLLPILLISLAANAAALSIFITNRLNAKPKPIIKQTVVASQDNLFDEVNPVDGYEIDTKFENLGPKMIALGVIDQAKFITVYEKSNQPLTSGQKEILLKGSNQKIKITRDNAYFLLNFFWAVGLVNKSKILDEGDMVKYGDKQGAGDFASTGGWSLAKGDTMNYYSKSALIPLTKEQEILVAQVAANIYRPCCNNSTVFPDCNHGMALLGLLQLMAGSNASENQMYEAAKYFNAFWFPGNYYDLALYFKNKDGKSFKDIDPKMLLSKDFSSASGWQAVKQWLADKNLVQSAPKQAGGCGV